MHMRVLFHNNCFDGACSAALFTRFHRECIGTATRFSYLGMQHKSGQQYFPEEFAGDENAVVDFKFTVNPKLTWWFDHHQSAFMTPEDRASFDAQIADGSKVDRYFFDPLYISCTGYIAKIGAEKFGFNIQGLDDFIYWANLIDGAKYESAKSAVELEAPAMKLATVIEAAKGDTILQLIPMLTEKSFAEILQQDFIQAQLAPLLAAHDHAMAIIRERARLVGDIVTFDLTDTDVEGYNKFIPYYLFPEANYTVGLTRPKSRTKISVGTNPWTTLPEKKLVNIANICEKWGGGGHARVGAISFPHDGVDAARDAAKQVIQLLQQD